MYGKEPIHIAGLEQLVDVSQTNILALMLDYLKNEMIDNEETIIEITHRLYERIEEEGLEVLSYHKGYLDNLALPRKQEFIGTFNRYRGLKIRKD